MTNPVRQDPPCINPSHASTKKKKRKQKKSYVCNKHFLPFSPNISWVETLAHPIQKFQVKLS